MRNFLRLKKMTNNKQQTAVDSLKDFFKQYDLAHSSLDYYEFKIPMHIFDLKFQETKEMEKQRMIEFAKQFIDVVNIEDKDIEIIYNETYGEANQ
jgi:hypothetical protein